MRRAEETKGCGKAYLKLRYQSAPVAKTYFFCQPRDFFFQALAFFFQALAFFLNDLPAGGSDRREH